MKQKQLLAIYHLRICYDPKYLHINLRGFIMCKKLDPTCTECKKPFKPFHKNQLTCGKPECKKLRTNRIRKKEEREFNCQVCGELSWSSNPTAVLCGKIRCRKTYQNNVNMAYGYKKKFLEKIKSGATVTGKYSDKEIETLIEMKLRGHTHTDIAIALKRVFPNVDNKVRFVFSDDRFIDTIEAIRFNIEAETRKANRRNVSYWNEKLNECWKNYF